MAFRYKTAPKRQSKSWKWNIHLTNRIFLFLYENATHHAGYFVRMLALDLLSIHPFFGLGRVNNCSPLHFQWVTVLFYWPFFLGIKILDISKSPLLFPLSNQSDLHNCSFCPCKRDNNTYEAGSWVDMNMHKKPRSYY